MSRRATWFAPARPLALGMLLAFAAASLPVSWAQAPAPAAPTARPRNAERPLPRPAVERASEAGGWWMVSQTACLAPPSDEIVDRMNGVLSKIGSQRQLREIVARIQEPYLTDTVRSALEREMQRVTRLQALAEGVAAVEAELAMVAKDMKPAPDRLDRPEWKLPEPVTTEAGLIALRDRVQRDLASACVGSIEQLQSRFIDERTGILPLLR